MRIDKYTKHNAHQDFIARYGKASNAATGSEVDANANVTSKNIATLETELYKRDAISINRLAMYEKLQEMYGTDTAEEYLRQLEEHEIYRHDETAVVGKPYNSYFFRVEDPKVNVLDKLMLHGRAFTRYLDGGSACHINLEEHLTKDQYLLLLNAAIQTGCNYFTFNVPNTVCRNCGFISKHRLAECPRCDGKDLDYATRVIGYLKLVSCFAEDRQREEERRHYNNGLEERTCR